MLIEAAYKVDPCHPSWEGAEHFLGYDDGEDGRLVDPEVVKYKTQRLKEEHGALRETRLKFEEEAKKMTALEAGKK